MTAPLAQPGTTANDHAARAWVLLGAEARSRGFRNTLALRRWCHSRGVPITKDGAKLEWIAPADIDRAVAGLVRRDALPANDADAVDLAFARITRQG